MQFQLTGKIYMRCHRYFNVRILAVGAVFVSTVFLLWLRMRWKRSMLELEKRIERATERAKLRFERIAEEIKADIEQQNNRV